VEASSITLPDYGIREGKKLTSIIVTPN